jgi:ATP-binding cassette, subfamily B, bacterial
MHVPLAGHRDLLGVYLKPQRGRVALLALLLLGSIGLQLLNPQVIRYFIDTAQAGGSVRDLSLAALAYIGIGLLGRGLGLLTAYAGLRVAWRATNALRVDLVSHVLRLDMPFHKAHTPGELISRVDGDVTGLAELFSTMVVKVAGNGLLVLAILYLLYRESPGTGLLLMLYVAIAMAALVGVQRIGVRAWTASREAWAEQLGFLEERIAATEDIRGVGAEQHALAGLLARMDHLLHKARSGYMANALGFVTTNFLYIVGYGLGLAIGAALYARGDVTIGAAFLIVSYIGMLAAPLEEIRTEAENLQQATAGVDRVTALLGIKPEVQEHATATLPAGALAVTFDHVSFRYTDNGNGTGPTDTPAAGADANLQSSIFNPQSTPLTLDSITFHLAPGRVLGILGRTGSGKTTLTRLLFRLYDPASGAIRLGDANGGAADLRDVALADLRGRVGMVTQDVQLFGATVAENVSLFDPAIGDDQIRATLTQLDLLDWVEGSLGGLHARIGAGGNSMSAGEAQLLAFTRILLRQPGLVILDEAASRLDPATERRLERAIDRLLAGRTGIVIAHRLGTVQAADDILILEGGRVVEFGERPRLAADPGSRFAGLLRTGMEEALA